MRPRIAIPLPHGSDSEYALRAIPQYERAIELSGAEPVRIPLDRTPAEVMKLIERCDGVLLPGSKADVDPAKFDAERDPKTAEADPKRDTVDELLLQDAYNMRKPVLGICYGLQILNVYRSGTLLQHIASRVNHEAGKEVRVAHEVEIDEGSKLAGITSAVSACRRPPSAVQRPSVDDETNNHRASLDRTAEGGRPHADMTRSSHSLNISVNSSHHQSAGTIGDGLRVVARCPEDGIIEALEGTPPDHFVLAVQWHPERSFDDDENSKAIFKALVEAARQKHQEFAGEFEAQPDAGEGAVRLRSGQVRAGRSNR
jgi:putative glutamine amidotransferase